MEFLKHMLEHGVTQFHVIKNSEEYLKQQAFTEIAIQEPWSLEAGGNYYVKPYRSVLIAFHVPEEVKNIRITACHTDFPMLKVKPSADMNKSGYHMLNIETYGGLLASTWFDRPLGMAGKVVLKGEDAFHPIVKLYDSGTPVAIIPSLAPHLKRGDAETKLNMQKELIPIVGISDAEQPQNFLASVAAKLEIQQEDILDYDLYLYNCDKCYLIGADNGLFASPRIDNVSSAAAILETIGSLSNQTESEAAKQNLCIGVFFDNEEIGSLSKQGADSNLLKLILEKIEKTLLPEKEFAELLPDTFVLSLDTAHGVHPNYSDKSDPTNPVLLGNGVVLKQSAAQRYVTDSEASAVIEALCEEEQISMQKTVNKTGMPGGTTLGPIISSYIPAKAVDMGIPVLAMHSACELAHKEDYKFLCQLLVAFWLK